MSWTDNWNWGSIFDSNYDPTSKYSDYLGSSSSSGSSGILGIDFDSLSATSSLLDSVSSTAMSAANYTDSSPSSESWWESVWDWTKSDLGSSAISAGIGGLIKGYELDAMADMKDDELDLLTERWEEQMALEREKLEILAGQLELEKAKQEDKETTRAKHNETINAGPSATPSITKR